MKLFILKKKILSKSFLIISKLLHTLSSQILYELTIVILNKFSDKKGGINVSKQVKVNALKKIMLIDLGAFNEVYLSVVENVETFDWTKLLHLNCLFPCKLVKVALIFILSSLIWLFHHLPLVNPPQLWLLASISSFALYFFLLSETLSFLKG